MKPVQQKPIRLSDAAIPDEEFCVGCYEHVTSVGQRDLSRIRFRNTMCGPCYDLARGRSLQLDTQVARDAEEAFHRGHEDGLRLLKMMEDHGVSPQEAFDRVLADKLDPDKLEAELES